MKLFVNARTKKVAMSLVPWATCAVKVCHGWMLFDNINEMKTFLKQK